MKAKATDESNDKIRLVSIYKDNLQSIWGMGFTMVRWQGQPIENVNDASDVVNALKDLHIPVLRWPGGSYADEYHWEMDGP